MFICRKTCLSGGFIISGTSGDIHGVENAAWSEVIFDSTLFPAAPVGVSLASLPERLQGAVRSRKAEFQAGRLAASRALAATGAPSCHVAATAQGVPLWPEGWRGSITHSAGRALAVAAPANAVTLMGVDCEKYDPAAAAEIETMVVNTGERACLVSSGIDYWQGVFIAFSARESLYKALWPEVQRCFDFSAAEVCLLEARTQRFALRLRETLTARWTAGTVISGRFCCEDGYITTLIAAQA